MAICLTVFVSAACAYAQETNPVLGTWTWNPVQGVCPEVHAYASDGTATVRSGDEVLEKTYAVAPADHGMYMITSKVISTNGGRDCLGATTEVGTTSTVYIQPTNSGSYFTCASQDGMSCYGTARRQHPAK